MRHTLTPSGAYPPLLGIRAYYFPEFLNFLLNMRRNPLVLEYMKLLENTYEELKELQDWGLPLPRRHYAYYEYLLEFISLIKSCITEVTD